MTSKLKDAVDLLRTDGPEALVSRSRQYFVRNQRLLNALTFHWTQSHLARRRETEESLSDILATVLDVRPGWHPYKVFAKQLRGEFQKFVRYVASKTPRTVLEIGTFRGGSLYVWTRAFDSTERVVGVDLPLRQDYINTNRRELCQSFETDTDVDIVFGDSHAEETREQIAAKTGGGVDLAFVDGDHTYAGVRRDFELCKSLVNEGGIIAFHDIKPHATSKQEKINHLNNVPELSEKLITVGDPEWGVSKFWKDIRPNYETATFLTHPQQMGKGIGIVKL